MAVIKLGVNTTNFTCRLPQTGTFARLSIIPLSTGCWSGAELHSIMLRCHESGSINRVYFDLETAEAFCEELQALIIELKAKEGGA